MELKKEALLAESPGKNFLTLRYYGPWHMPRGEGTCPPGEAHGETAGGNQRSLL